MALRDELSAATAAHGLWKARLRSAIDAGTCEMTVATARSDNQCAFGKFLEGAVADTTKHGVYQRSCAELHRKFHLAAGGVLELALAGKKEAALKAMDGGSEFGRLSAGLTMELKTWEKECR